jgi:hypothetical protein
MTHDDPFLARLRQDAAPLRYDPDDIAVARIRARIRERVARPGVAEILAAWFRPLAAALVAVAIAAAAGIATVPEEDESITPSTVQIVMAGDTYDVGD